MLQCYLSSTATKERLLVLPNQKGIELGRGTPLLDIADNRCSRRQLLVTFDRAAGKVIINACGGNPIEVRPKGAKKPVFVKKGEQRDLNAEDTFLLLPGVEELSYFIEMDRPKRALEAHTSSPSLLDVGEKEAADQGPAKRHRDSKADGEAKQEQPATKKRKVEEEEGDDDEDTIELKTPLLTAAAPAPTPAPASAPAPASKQVPCKYGAACYNKQPKHLQKYSHPQAEPKPGEKRKGEEKEESVDSAKEELAKPAVKKQKTKTPCKYGAKCYDKSPEHLQRFDHPQPAKPADSSGEQEEQKDEPEKAKKGQKSTDDWPKPAPKAKAEKSASTSSSSTSELSGKKVVMTGALTMFLRKDLVDRLKKAGATILGNISANTDILIAGDKAGAKLQKAEQLGVEVWDEAKLLSVLNKLNEEEKPDKGKEKGEPEDEENEVMKGEPDDFKIGSDQEGEDVDSHLPKPKNVMQDGESFEVSSNTSTSTYTIKRCFGGVYYCTCPAWRNQNLSVDQRSCKHLREHLGEEYETARVGRAATAPVVRSAANKEAPALLLAHKWEKDTVDPTGWWMSEKLDGVRAYWNGKKFISRLGNPFSAADWFTAGLPDNIELDGELWGGRGAFQTTVSVVKSQGEDKRWKGLKYMIFDAPKINKPFEERMNALKEYFTNHTAPFAKVIDMEKCKGVKHLEAKLKYVEEQRGEGLMLRQPGSLYKAGRSTTLLKVKSFHDAEARVTGYEAGKGKHKGRVGALQVEMANGTKFKVGTGLSDAERESPPKVGSIITYRFQELTPDGVPRFPSYVGVRIDMDEPKDPDLPNVKPKKV